MFDFFRGENKKNPKDALIEELRAALEKLSRRKSSIAGSDGEKIITDHSVLITGQVTWTQQEITERSMLEWCLNVLINPQFGLSHLDDFRWQFFFYLINEQSNSNILELIKKVLENQNQPVHSAPTP